MRIAVACAAIAFGVASAAGIAQAASKPPEDFETKAKHAILMDSGANLVLYEKDADTQMVPASMSKLMTLAIVFRELKAGRITLDDQFTVTEYA